ncbi:MAG: hypothetical protein ACSHW1_07930 [Yoonia sp.]|uniref:hypothetical protein n=1 Tax=Yoonia sp. TaxID=2212373 RepID=UPI003EF7ECE4
MARGAGGSDGGTVAFIVGVIMMIGGGYLLLNSIIVRPNFGMGAVAFRVGGLPVTSGFILIPFMFGVGLIFYNAKSWFGWVIAGISIIAMIFGVIANMQLQFARLSILDLLIILTLLVGGLGLFLRSLRKAE